MEVTISWQFTEKLFVCFGKHFTGVPLSKDRLAYLVKEVIAQEYSNAGQEVPSSHK